MGAHVDSGPSLPAEKPRQSAFVACMLGSPGIIAIFALSSLLHVATDFLLHHDDARAQWLPLSDWVFRSPVSYWNPDHYGRVFAVAEIGLAIGLVVTIGRRYSKRHIWLMLGVAMLGYTGSAAVTFMDMADHDRGPGSCQVQVVEFVR